MALTDAQKSSVRQALKEPPTAQAAINKAIDRALSLDPSIEPRLIAAITQFDDNALNTTEMLIDGIKISGQAAAEKAACFIADYIGWSGNNSVIVGRAYPGCDTPVSQSSDDWEDYYG